MVVILYCADRCVIHCVLIPGSPFGPPSAAQTNRCSSHHSSHAEIRSVVRWIDAGIHCKYLNIPLHPKQFPIMAGGRYHTRDAAVCDAFVQSSFAV